MVARKVKPEPNEIPGDVSLEAQGTPQDEPERTISDETIITPGDLAVPLDIESRRLEHQRRINEGGK